MYLHVSNKQAGVLSFNKFKHVLDKGNFGIYFGEWFVTFYHRYTNKYINYFIAYINKITPAVSPK